MQIIIISGADKCGKSALAKFIKESNKNKNVRILNKENSLKNKAGFWNTFADTYAYLSMLNRPGLIIVTSTTSRSVKKTIATLWVTDSTVIHIPIGAYVGYKNTLPKQMSYDDTTNK